MERKNTSLINLIKQTQERSNANFEQQASLAPPPAAAARWRVSARPHTCSCNGASLTGRSQLL